MPRETKRDQEIEKIKHQVKNVKNVTRLELDTNKNLIADEQVDVKKYPLNQTTEPFCLSSTPTISTCNYTADITSYPSMVTHWMAPSSTMHPHHMTTW